MPVSTTRRPSDLASTSFSSASTSTYFFLPMVRLQTIDTRAAPMAPEIAAAPPPPGVGAALASSVRNFSMLSVSGRCVSVTGASSGHRLGEGVDLLGVEHLVGALEELADAGAVQLELQAAEAQRPEGLLAVAVFGLVHHVDAADAGRRLGVVVGDELDGRFLRP